MAGIRGRGGHNQCGMSLVEFVFSIFTREAIFLILRSLFSLRKCFQKYMINRTWENWKCFHTEHTLEIEILFGLAILCCLVETICITWTIL